MKTIYFYIAIVCMVLQACSGSGAGEKSSLQGTWKLLSGTTIQGKDTVHTDYTQGQEMIK